MEHGTLSGANKHYARGETPCKECKAVRAAYERNRRRSKPLTQGQKDRISAYQKTEHAIRLRRDNCYRKLYGITIDEYDAIHTDQGGTCGICRNTCATGQHLAVDHDHGTGTVRGLLCSDCNLGLGKLGDTISGLQAAIAYIERRNGL
tara:strand:- start:13 stop:456 length:444 start_codon:yes stop_codon:yes gene_type:complete